MPSFITLIDGKVQAPDNTGTPVINRRSGGNFLGNIDLFNSIQREALDWAKRLTDPENIPNTVMFLIDQIYDKMERLPKHQTQELLPFNAGLLGSQFGDVLNQVEDLIDQFDPGTQFTSVEEYLSYIGERYRTRFSGYILPEENILENPPRFNATPKVIPVENVKPEFSNEPINLDEGRFGSSEEAFKKIDDYVKSLKDGDHESYGALDESSNHIFASPQLIIEQFPFQGRKSLEGLTLDSNHNWDLQISPFTRDSGYREAPLSAFTPKLPTVTLSSGRKFDYNEWMPVVSYSWNEGQTQVRDIEMYNGSISVPDGFMFNQEFTVELKDDENRTLKNYFHRLVNAMCNPLDASIADYKDVCHVIKLWLFRGDRKITAYSELIVIFTDFTSEYSGTEEGESPTLSVAFKVVGYVQSPENTYESSDNITMSKINVSTSK